MDRRREPRALARPRVRRRLPFNNNMANAALAIQAAARGFLARRRAARMRGDRRLLSPMDIQRKFHKAKKPMGQVVVPKVFPKARIGSLVGTAKSKRPVNYKPDPLQVKLHIDTTNSVLQNQVAYFGFPDAGSQDEQLKQGCIALVNMFFRRAGLKLPTIKSTIEGQNAHLPDAPPDYFSCRLNLITIYYVRWDAEGSGVYENASFVVSDSSTIESVALLIFADIKDKAVNHGKWPLQAKLWQRELNHISAAGQEFEYQEFATYDLNNVMVDFKYMRKYKWQNVTPSGWSYPGKNSGHTYERSTINDIQANPLSGKIYKFKGPTPLMRSTLQASVGGTMPAIDLIQKQGLGTAAHDYLDTRAFRDNVPAPSFDNALSVPFKQPFKAASLFKNALTEDKVYMPPGGYKQLIRSESITMNFTRFCHATVFDDGETLAKSGYVQPKISKIGTCTLFALEPAVRTVVNELVQVQVNSELWYKTKCRVADKKQPVISNVKVEEGFNFQEA